MQSRKLSALISVLVIAAVAAPAAPVSAKPGTAPSETAVVAQDSGRTGSDVTADPSATSSDFTIMSCYGSARTYTTNQNYDWPSATYPATTTSNCGDINVKPDYDIWVQACLWYSSLGYYKCNDLRMIRGGTWGTAATSVYDGTKFYLHFTRASRGLVAY